MKEQILSLRAQGKSYTEIMLITGCAKGTVAYHCGEQQKDKTSARNKVNQLSLKYRVSNKIDAFLSRGKGTRMIYVKRADLHKQIYNKVIANPTCYLTGRVLNLQDHTTYCLDHVIPYHISQDNSLENMGLVCKEANFSKSYLTLDQYLALCKEVLEHHGFTVIK